MPKKFGALPMQDIFQMMEAGMIKNARRENVNPASLDLSISDEVYRVEGIFQTRVGESVNDLLHTVRFLPHNLRSPLERGFTYLARLKEEFNIPKNVYGYCNPKSSTGRNDIHVRVIANGVPRYDAVTPKGYQGDLWLAVIPRSFSVLLNEGDTLSQVRFFNQDTRFDELALEINMERLGLLWDKKGNLIHYKDLTVSDKDGAIILSIDLEGWRVPGEVGDIVGWECRGLNKIFEFSKRDYVPREFFEPLRKREDGYIHLKQGGFYILSTAECVRVHPELACEMSSMDERSGEFRSHYAGFIDPGWGYGAHGEGKGRPLTLEVRPFEDLIIRDRQPIAKIKFEHMREIPDVLYDAKGTSHYIEQAGPLLSRHFKIAV
jgi:dCTP deaminase